MSTEILFLLIFFIFAVLQGIGQKRRQASRQGEQPPSGEVEGDASRQGRDRISSTPGERSRAEPPGRARGLPQERERGRPPLRERSPVPSRERPPMAARERLGGPQPSRGGATSSEGLVPKDIWEEIMGLARGELEPPKPTSATRPAPPVPRHPDPREPAWEEVAPRRGAAPPSTVAARFPELSEEEKAPRRVPVPASTPPPDQRKPGPGAVGRPTGAREELFGRGTPRELQKAVVLREVLGPPLALRE